MILCCDPQLRGKAYANFLSDLREYLGGFLTRTQPLVDLNEVRCGVVWCGDSKGKSRGWTYERERGRED